MSPGECAKYPTDVLPFADVCALWSHTFTWPFTPTHAQRAYLQPHSNSSSGSSDNSVTPHRARPGEHEDALAMLLRSAASFRPIWPDER